MAKHESTTSAPLSREVYVRPALTRHGTVADLTAGGQGVVVEAAVAGSYLPDDSTEP